MKSKLIILAFIAVASFALADEHTDKGHVAVKHSLRRHWRQRREERAAG